MAPIAQTNVEIVNDCLAGSHSAMSDILHKQQGDRAQEDSRGSHTRARKR